ncbi:MAG: TetR/AcrR family transcriptional regulator [Chloroflexi bacterium]|nr:TetR/AcrR family transcriptional regulator [Chloroflexota bacterium]
MSPRPAKAAAPTALAEEILQAAWAQIAVGGTDAINLRALGRTLGITAPAIYHYYPDRSALIRALQQSHVAQGTTQLQQLWQKHGAARAHTGMHALCQAYRAWAVATPYAYQVVFAPDPGQTMPPAMIIPLLAPFVAASEALRQQHLMRIRTSLTLTPEGQRALATWQSIVGAVDATAVATTVVIWSRLHGLVGGEIVQQIPAFGVDWAQLFRFELNALMREMFYMPQRDTTQT